jgi:adenylate kinase family enzyme
VPVTQARDAQVTPPSSGVTGDRSVAQLWHRRDYRGRMLLRAGDALPRCPRRVLVAGTSGAGKTTLAALLGDVLQVPHIEIDALFHGPTWTPRESFAADVDAFSSHSRWVTEWQYDEVRALLAERADLVVWLDLPRATVMRQVVLRTVRRRLRRQVLWNGNIEPPLWTFVTDREHIVRWAWNTHDRTEQRLAVLGLERPELGIVRLHSWREAREWLDGAARAAGLDRLDGP